MFDLDGNQENEEEVLQLGRMYAIERNQGELFWCRVEGKWPYYVDATKIVSEEAEPS
jgi:hypothetical protein